MTGAASAETMRAFIALNLDVASVRKLADLSRALRDRALAPEARWIPSTKTHLTLRFLGVIDVGLAPALVDELRRLVQSLGTKAFPQAALTRLSAFPSEQEARVIIALVDDASGQVAGLARAVDGPLSRLGFVAEAREFRPHVTLARTEVAVDASKWLGGEGVGLRQVQFPELVLYRSDGTPAGAEYRALARFGLGSDERA
jgi:2'-5' RNA ligase